MKRRDFLRNATLMTAPALISGCSLSPRPTIAPPRPGDVPLARFGLDEPALGRIMRALGGRGGDFGETYFQQRIEHRTRFAGSGNATIASTSTGGAGLRVVSEDTAAFAASDVLDEAALLDAAKRVASGSATEAALGYERPVYEPPGRLYPAAGAFDAGDDALRRTIVEQVATLARRDADVTDVEVNLADSDEWILIATLDGRLVADRRPMTRLSVQVTKARGDVSHAGFANVAGRHDLGWYDDDRLQALVATALERTDILFEARRPPEGVLPVILAAGTSGALLHEALGHALEADFVHDGTSPYGDAIGTAVANREVSLVDDATIPGERGALNVDDEGVPGRRKKLVENGVLKSLVHDLRSARRAGVSPTGNGRRESWRHEPQPRMTCTYIENGRRDPAELVASVERGIIAESYTGGAVDLGGGDFRFRVRHGWYLEDGRKRVPVRDFEIIGNGPAMLRDITLVASDGTLDRGGWSCGKKGQVVPVSHGMPSVLVAGLGIRPLS